MIRGVERLIQKRITVLKVPPADRGDAAQDCRLVLWKVSAGFDPTGRAKWSSFAQACIDNTLKQNRGEAIRARATGGRAGVEVDDMRTADPASLDTDDEPGVSALTAAVRRQLVGRALAGFTPKARALVAAVVLDGLTADRVAEQQGVHPKLVGIALRAALGRIALAGHLPADLAGRFGFNARDLADRADGATRNRTTAARHELVREAAALGLDPKDIAAGLGVSVAVVQADIRHARRVRIRRATVASPVPTGQCCTRSRRTPGCVRPSWPA